MTLSCLTLFMKAPPSLVAALFWWLGFATAPGQLITIEPDDYADRTVLTGLFSEVMLSTTLSDNVPVGLFVVTAHDDGFDFAPTGQRVFGHAHVPFWNNERRLRMDFAGLVSTIQIDFAGGNSFTQERGRIDVYGTGDILLDSYTTGLLGGGQVDTMAISRPAPDIQWAVAYVPSGEGSFGRLDHLAFSAPVPEPSSLALAGAGLLTLWVWRRRRAPSPRSPDSGQTIV